jgi:hypothetical protein
LGLARTNVRVELLTEGKAKPKRGLVQEDEGVGGRDKDRAWSGRQRLQDDGFEGSKTCRDGCTQVVARIDEIVTQAKIMHRGDEHRQSEKGAEI